jgi:hypothetical protein
VEVVEERKEKKRKAKRSLCCSQSIEILNLSNTSSFLAANMFNAHADTRTSNWIQDAVSRRWLGNSQTQSKNEAQKKKKKEKEKRHSTDSRLPDPLRTQTLHALLQRLFDSIFLLFCS